MNHTIVSRRQVAVILAVAALISSIITLFAYTRASPFYLEVSMRSSSPGTAQVYYDIGRGIGAADSTTARLSEGESTIRLPLPAGEYRAIRFDPIDHGYCHVTIHYIRIIDLSGRVVRPLSLEEFIGFVDLSERRIANGELDVNLKARESDPSLGIVLTSPLALRPSASPFWQFVLKAFFLSFVPLSALGVTWLLFVRRWPWNGLPVCALIAFVYFFARSRFFAPISFDEEAFIWYGWLVNNGSVPYRDIFEPKPPVIFFANALGLALFGLKDFLFRIVPTTVALASVVVFYVAMVGRRFVPWLAALLAAQVGLWLLGPDFHDTGLNDSETYGFAFVVLGFSFGSLASRPGSRSGRITLQVLSGMFFGLAVLSKELFVLSVIPAWLMAARSGENGGWDWRQLGISAAGGVATGLLFAAYLVTHSAFGRYLDVLRFARTFAANYCTDIGSFPRVSGISVLWPCWQKLHALLYNFAHLAFVLPLWAAFIFLRPQNKKFTTRLSELVIAGSAVALGMVAVSIGYCFWEHYFLMGTSGLLLFSVLGGEALSEFLAQRNFRTSIISLLGLSVLFLYVANVPTRALFTEGLRSPIIPLDPVAAETIEAHSRPGDYILATEGPLIYVIMNRKCPISVPDPADDVLPYLADENATLSMEALRAELEKNLPKVCYFAGWFRARQQKWHELLYDPLLVKYHYVKVNESLWYLPDGSDSRH